MSLTCGDLIKRGRALYGEQTALIFEQRRFTFAEQASRMARLANALLGKGLRKQDRVAVLARNCSEYIECFGAGEIAGFVTINLNSRLAQPELAEDRFSRFPKPRCVRVLVPHPTASGTRSSFAARLAGGDVAREVFFARREHRHPGHFRCDLGDAER